MKGKHTLTGVAAVAVAALALGITSSTASSRQGNPAAAAAVGNEELAARPARGTARERLDLGPGAKGWHAALAVRSDALNRRYGLGAHVSHPASARTSGWLESLVARSDALNRHYGLGVSRSAASAPGWLGALTVRSEALNRQFRLGDLAR